VPDRASDDGESHEEPTMDVSPSGRVDRFPTFRKSGRVDVAEGAMVCGRSPRSLGSRPARRSYDYRQAPGRRVASATRVEATSVDLGLWRKRCLGCRTDLPDGGMLEHHGSSRAYDSHVPPARYESALATPRAERPALARAPATAGPTSSDRHEAAHGLACGTAACRAACCGLGSGPHLCVIGQR
jgi:hypothetical protein